MGGVNHGCIQHLSGAVHHRHLAPHAVAGVQAHGDPALYRRLHQQGPQVQGEIVNGPLAGLIGEAVPDLPLQGGIQQPVIGVRRRRPDEVPGPGPGPQHRAAKQNQGGLPVRNQADLQKRLPLAPVYRQDLMTLQAADILTEAVVQPVNAVLLFDGGTLHHTGLQHICPQHSAHAGVIGDVLGNDVTGSLQRVLCRLHALFRVNIAGRGLQGVGTVRPLGVEQRRQRLQPLLPGRSGAGAALLLIRAVQVFRLRQSGGGVNRGGKLIGELSLALDGALDLLPAFLQVPQILQPLLQGAQRGVVHGTVEFLTVPGDEGDGIALVQQGHDVLHVPLAPAQLPGQNLHHCLH